MQSIFGKLVVAIIVVFSIADVAAAEPSLLFADPPTQEYFRGPPGKGLLRICKSDDAPDTRKMAVPMGTYFDDQGSGEGPAISTTKQWLLTVVTTQSVTFRPRQKCAVVRARVEPTEPPPAHPELKSVMRFQKSDRRYFEVGASPDPDAPVPNLAPWNADFPSLNATAASDFE